MEKSLKMTDVNMKNNWQTIEEDLPIKKSESFQWERTYYRYMSEEDLDKILEGSFKFNNPSNWWDPFESLMVNGDYSDIDFEKPATYVACFTSEANSEAHWKMYKGDLSKPCIRVEVDIRNLLGLFYLAEAFDIQSHIYIGNAFYQLKEKSILTLGTTSKYHNQAVPSPFLESDYADLLLIKRNSFRWENESRIIILKEGSQENELFLRFSPEFATTFIKSIQIEPNKNNKEADRLFKKYEKKWEKLGTPQYAYPFKCSKSTLYDAREPLIFKKRKEWHR